MTGRVVAGPRWGGRGARRRDRELPGLAGSLARSIRTGSTLLGAIGQVAPAVPPPLSDELSAVVRAVGRGRPLDAALAEWSQTAGSSSVDLVVAACRFGHRDGGDLAPALDSAAVSLLDALDAEDEARALTSQARSSAGVLVALPVLGAGTFCLLDPAVAHTLFMTTAGRVCLAIGAVLDATACLVMSKLVRGAVA